jgi:hypothetical protein
MPNFLEAALRRDSAALRKCADRSLGKVGPRKSPQRRCIETIRAQLLRRGLIPVSDVAVLTGIRDKVIFAFSSMNVIDHPKFINSYFCYSVEHLACFAQARIYATFSAHTGDYFDMKIMAEYLKEHWPGWEDKYEKYQFAHQRRRGCQGSRS